MSAPANPPQGLDLAARVDLAAVPEGDILLGHGGDEAGAHLAMLSADAAPPCDRDSLEAERELEQAIAVLR